MTRFTLLVLPFLASLVFAGCQQRATFQTASGCPEVQIAHTTKEKVADAIMQRMVNGGASLSRQTDSMLAFDKTIDDVWMSLALGSRYDVNPAARYTYSLMNTGDNVRVVGRVAGITNPGSAFEKQTDMTGSKYAQGMQQLLFKVQEDLSPAPK